MLTRFQFNENVHPVFANGTQKRFTFENGYAVSVITGDGAYSSDDSYEVAILKNGKICYDTPITDDVIAYCSGDDVVSILKQVAEFPHCAEQVLHNDVRCLEDSTIKSILSS